MTTVAIVIVCYKSIPETLDCLKSLNTLSLPQIQATVFVIDNSADNTLEKRLPKLKFNLHYFKSLLNLGFAEGVNEGIKKAGINHFDYFLLLNSDTIVSKDLLINLVSLIKANPNYGLVSPKIYFAPGKEYHKDRYQKEDLGKVIWYAGGRIDWNNVYCSHVGVDQVDDGQFDRTKPTDFATGCCLLIPSQIISKVGLLDTKYFLYFEDVDYSMRIRKAGFEIIYAPQSFLHHKNASSSGSPGSSLHIYYQTRNRLYFGFKYASFKTKIHLFKEAVKILFSDDKIRKNAVSDFFINKMGRGTFHQN